MKTGLDSYVDVIFDLHKALGPNWHQNGCLFLVVAHTLDYLEKHVMIDFFVINQIDTPFLTYFMQH